jgi:thiosulfate sulfurtransferase
MFKPLTHVEAKSLIAERSIVIIDARDQESYAKGHIENAIHLTATALQDFCKKTEQVTPILVYCYHGISSQSVAQYLVDQGFSEVYSLAGGFEKWKAHHPISK